MQLNTGILANLGSDLIFSRLSSTSDLHSGHFGVNDLSSASNTGSLGGSWSNGACTVGTATCCPSFR